MKAYCNTCNSKPKGCRLCRKKSDNSTPTMYIGPINTDSMKTTNDIYKEAIKTWGPTLQLLIAAEELGELQQAIFKHLRGRESNIEEELADVEIMLDQLRLIFDFKHIPEIKAAKLVRLRNTIQMKKYADK